MKIVWTGAAGFIAGYTIEELLNNGHEVVGIDNFSKYGKVEKSYDKHLKYTFIEGDAKDVELMKKASEDADVIVSGAAMIGGISYFHEYAYELMAENERITASAFDAAIWAFKNKKLKKIVVMSSSMVYESTDQFPTPETAIDTSPPPISMGASSDRPVFIPASARRPNPVRPSCSTRMVSGRPHSRS